jgi:thymidine kinase
MQSGKTAHLLAVAGNYEALGKKILLMKPRIDTRSAIIESRLKISRPLDHYLDRDTVIPDSWLENVSCILIDEAQFMSEFVIDQLRNITISHNIPVICYGIRSDYQLRLFEGSKRLFEVADNIEELNKTICAHCCLKKSIVNHRKVKSDEQILIGDSIYESICYSCYVKTQ